MADRVYEIWFRGEGVGVAPARPGGHLHDFGDGMYLTDSEAVAKVYAQRRGSNVAGQRVWMVQIERATLGSVLDLTKDVRWERFMNAPLGKGLQNNRLHYVKLQHELYDQYFREF